MPLRGKKSDERPCTICWPDGWPQGQYFTSCEHGTHQRDVNDALAPVPVVPQSESDAADAVKAAVADATAPLEERIKALEAENESLKTRLAEHDNQVTEKSKS